MRSGAVCGGRGECSLNVRHLGGMGWRDYLMALCRGLEWWRKGVRGINFLGRFHQLFWRRLNRHGQPDFRGLLSDQIS
jgi:hypothetical protein